MLEFSFGELTRVYSVYNATSVLERAAFAATEPAGGPTSVNEPTVNFVFRHAFGKHLGVASRVEDNERCAVTCGESGNGLKNTIFSPRSFRCITSQEVVTSLFRGQSANGRKNTKGIASQHDDVGGLTVNNTRDLSVGDELNRVSATSVLSDADVIIIRNSGNRAVDDVLKDAAKFNGVEDIRLLLSREVDALGVTSALNVEDTSVRPDMFVVADEKTARVSGECGLAGTGKTEKESNITLLNADIGRRVERELTEFYGLKVMLER